MHKNPEQDINRLTNHLFRENYGKMVAYLSRKYGYREIDNIVDAVQESFEAALKNWRFNGIPENSFAWLFKVAQHKLLNKIRQSNLHLAHRNNLRREMPEEDFTEKEMEESQLRLLIFFSKADFSERNKVILSLYFLCGFGYNEIANALLLKIETVKKIIARSKETIQRFSAGYDPSQLMTVEEDLQYLLKIIYLLFNEGYKTTRKNGAIKYDLCYEAIRLGKLVLNYHPENSALNALLALMFLNTSRFEARTDPAGWVSLEEQDRTLWNGELISEGFYYLKQAKNNQEYPDKYYLEALISSVHSSSKSYQETEWQKIVYLYQQLELLEPSSVLVKLNRIIAESNYKEIVSLISELDTLEPLMTGEMAFAFYSSKAHLYFKLKNREQASKYYQLSVLYTKNITDLNFIQKKLKEFRRNDW